MPNESLNIDCSDPMYWGNSYTTSTTSTYPITNVTMSPTNITWAVGQGVEKEYVEKLEKHIDELEEDIEYFNGQLQEKDVMIHHLLDKTDELKKDMSDMNCHIIYLEGRLKALEDKINK